MSQGLKSKISIKLAFNKWTKKCYGVLIIDWERELLKKVGWTLGFNFKLILLIYPSIINDYSIQRFRAYTPWHPNGLAMYQNVQKIIHAAFFAAQYTECRLICYNELQYTALHVLSLSVWSAIKNELHHNKLTHVMCVNAVVWIGSYRKHLKRPCPSKVWNVLFAASQSSIQINTQVFSKSSGPTSICGAVWWYWNAGHIR